MSVTAIRIGYHFAGDLERESLFYREALGLVPRFTDPGRWAEFQAGPSRFALASRAESPHHAGGAMLVFACDTLEPMRERIARHGGRIVAERDMGAHGRTLTAADPGGTPFMLFSR